MNDSAEALSGRNPFSPGFGKAPVSLVGRDETIDDLCESLRAGPDDERFTSMVMGIRGSGKTVMLTEVEDRMASEGWLVISVDGASSGLLGRISDMIGQASREHETPDLERFAAPVSKATSTGIKLGPYRKVWSAQTNPPQDMSLRERLTILARIAQQHDIGVLLTVDELHSAEKDETRRLANDLQHITQRKKLPLAFVGAGLLEIQYTLMEGKKNTFFKRCNPCKMTPLSVPDAIQGLRVPIEYAGGSIDDDALLAAARSVGDSPYRLQLIGHSAWKVANAPHGAIDEFAVSQAIHHADEVVARNISEPAFYDLSSTEQQYLESLVMLGEQGTNSRIATVMGKDERDVRGIARRLDLAGYIHRQSGKAAALTTLVPREIIIQECDLDIADTPHSAEIDTIGPSAPHIPSSRSAACRRWMPRSKAYCVLPRNHSGRCRSR